MDIEFSPSPLEVDYDKNLTELYEAITNMDWDKAIAVCKQDPVQAATWVVRHYDQDDSIMWRFLPIHSACARQPPATVVSALIQAYADGPRCKDDQGMFPLHYACGNQAGRDVIKQLLSAYPGATKKRDPRGMLPIHYLACWGPSSVSTIDLLLVQDKSLVHAKDNEGQTPLDLAMEGEYEEKDSVISALKKWMEKSPARALAEEKKEDALPVRSSNDDGNEIRRLQGEIRDLNTMVNTKNMSSRRNADSAALAGELESIKALLKVEQDKNSELSKELESTKKDLSERKSELKGLRVTLGDMMDQHETVQKKHSALNNRLGSLCETIQNVLEEQANLKKELSSQDKMRKKAMEAQKQLLEDWRSNEESMASNDNTIRHALDKQAREIEAVMAVLKAARE